jgi:predicted transcriptional regulator
MSRPKSNAELMRTWRRLLEMSTAQAGERLEMSPRAIEDIEQGRRRADDVLTRLALEALIHEAAHVRDCRDAALAAVEEKSSRKKK